MGDAQLGQPLTDRELSVLQGMSRGLSNTAIGHELYLSMDTVKVHARRLFQKLGARDRAHAVSLGHTKGLLTGTPTAARTAPRTSPDGPPPPRVDASIELRDCPHHIELCAYAFFPNTISPTLARQRAQDGLRRLLGTTEQPS